MSQPSLMVSFFGELQRRHVYKVGAMYAVAGWLLVQVITQVFPIYEISTHVQRIFVGLIVAGFPVAVVLAWLFDITPAGIVRTESLPASGESPAAVRERRGTDRKLNYVLGALLVIGIGYVVLEHALLSRPADAPAVAAAQDKSIAVLPFENLSDDKANAYFAEGIQDEILTRLAKIGALKVIARTSTQALAAKPGNLAEIARQLGVVNIVEGSVQKVGDAVHINIQLIKAADESHLWAESYNRRLDDVFAVEGEVAQTVADTLNAKLSGLEQQAVTARPTTNPAAYEAYARGRAIETAAFDMPHEANALAAYEEAVQLDPNFAQAWADIGSVASLLYFNGERIAPDFVRKAAETAMALNPQLGEAWRALGDYRYHVLRDMAGAVPLYEKAQQLLPNDARVHVALARVNRRLGNWQESLAHMRAGAVLDPSNVPLLDEESDQLLFYLRRFDQERDVLSHALKLAPGDTDAIAAMALLEQADGHLDAAAGWVSQLPPHYDVAGWYNYAPLNQYAYERRNDKVIELAEASLPPGEGPLPLNSALYIAIMLAQAQMRSGHADAARATYLRVIRSIKPTADTPVRIDDEVELNTLALAYAGIGDKAAAQDASARALDAYRDDAINHAASEIGKAIVDIETGNREAAIAALPHLLQIPAGLTVGLLKLDPVWDSIRDDPRVQKLIADHAPAAEAGMKP
jgi:TolB-like protein